MWIAEPAPELSKCGSRSRLQNYMWIPEPALETYLDPGACSRICGSWSRLRNHMWIPEPAPELSKCGILELAPEKYGSQSRLRNYEYADPRAGSGTKYVDPGAGSGTICGSPETAKNGQVPPRWSYGGKPCVGTPIKHEGKKSEFGAGISAGGAGWLRGRGYS